MNEISAAVNGTTPSRFQSAADMLPLVYDDLRKLAVSRMSHEFRAQTLQPTALVHEAWLSLLRSGSGNWESRAHFFSAAELAMKRVLVQNARRKLRLKRGAGLECVPLEDENLPDTSPEEKALLIQEALERFRAAAPGKAKLVEMKFFDGFTNQEVAARLKLTERTVERHWAYAKAWLFRAIQQEL